MYTKCIQFYYLEYYFKNYIMDYFERDVKDYFDVEVSEIEVEHNELYICSSDVKDAIGYFTKRLGKTGSYHNIYSRK